MRTIRTAAITVSTCTVILSGGLLTGAWGQAGVPSTGAQSATLGSTPSQSLSGEPEEAPFTLKGSVVCVGCTLDEARETHPKLDNLYELTHEQGKLVMEAEMIGDPGTWENMVGLTHQVPVRAEDRVWQALTAEENLSKDVEIAGMLSNTRMLDITQISIAGKTVGAPGATTARP